MKYHTIFEDQWNNIHDKIRTINPNSEYDLINIVVKTLNECPSIYHHVESKVNQHNNIKYYKIKRHDKFESDTHCVFIGVKILSDNTHKQEFLEESKELISILYNKYGEGTSVRNKLIIFDKTNTLTDDDINSLENHQRTNRVKIYFC